MNIENYLNEKEFKTRSELAEQTGLNDRKVRSEINKLRKTRVVISNSKTKGYRLAKKLNTFNTAEEARNELMQVKHTVNENNSRIKDFVQSNKVCEEHLKRLAVEIMLLENQKHIPSID